MFANLWWCFVGFEEVLRKIKINSRGRLLTAFTTITILTDSAETSTCFKVALLAVQTSLSTLLSIESFWTHYKRKQIISCQANCKESWLINQRLTLITPISCVPRWAYTATIERITFCLAIPRAETGAFVSTSWTPPTQGTSVLAQGTEESSWTVAGPVNWIASSTILTNADLQVTNAVKFHHDIS